MTKCSKDGISRTISESPESFDHRSSLADAQDVDSAAQLLARGARVDDVDCAGLTPLHHAAKSGREAVVRFLIANGADANAVEMSSGRTPIFYVSSASIVDVLFAAGADINHRDYTGRTALHKAAEDGSVGVAQALICRGLGVDDRDQESWTPLHYAAHWQGNEQMIGVLLRYGADPRALNRCGMTPSDLAASRYHWPIVAPSAS